MYKTYPESSYELIGPQAIYEYIKGGKGIVSLKSPTGVHRTYAFNKPRHDPFPEGTLFIYAQTSSSVWLYVGMYDPDKGFRITRQSNYDKDHEIAKGAEYIVKMMEGRITSTPMQLFHAGMCSVCGRRLTKPESILIGMGPKCRKKSI